MDLLREFELFIGLPHDLSVSGQSIATDERILKLNFLDNKYLCTSVPCVFSKLKYLSQTFIVLIILKIRYTI